MNPVYPYRENPSEEGGLNSRAFSTRCYQSITSRRDLISKNPFNEDNFKALAYNVAKAGYTLTKAEVAYIMLVPISLIESAVSGIFFLLAQTFGRLFFLENEVTASEQWLKSSLCTVKDSFLAIGKNLFFWNKAMIQDISEYQYESVDSDTEEM